MQKNSNTSKNWVIFLILMAEIVGYFILNGSNSNAHEITTFIDNIIPLYSYFVIPYLFWFMYIISILIYMFVANKKMYRKLVLCSICVFAISFAIFWFYPTVIARPTISITDSFSYLVAELYRLDKPYNCFPSIHVEIAVIMTCFFICQHKGTILRLCSIMLCVLIILSTLFIKQHYFYDAIVGTFLGIILFVFWQYEAEKLFLKNFIS